MARRADSRDAFRTVSAERSRAVASVLATVSDGVSDIVTAVCIRQANASDGEGASARPALSPRSAPRGSVEPRLAGTDLLLSAKDSPPDRLPCRFRLRGDEGGLLHCRQGGYLIRPHRRSESPAMDCHEGGASR